MAASGSDAQDCFVKKRKEEEAKYKKMIADLPREKGWSSEYIYQYQGSWFHSEKCGLERVMWMQEHFEARPDDVLLASLPKSGTTWLKALIFTITNRTRYEYDSSQHPLLANNPHQCVPTLELMRIFGCTVPPFEDPEFLSSPRLLAAHAPYSLLSKSVIKSGCRIVYICRNPKDVFISSFYFMPKWRLEGSPPLSMEEAFDLFCKGISPFGPFWDHVVDYWKASLEFPNRILFLKYEDMKKNPLVGVKKLADFLGQPFSLEEEEDGVAQGILDLCSYENLSKLEVNKTGYLRFMTGVKNDVFFRKGKVGDWKNHLTPQMIERIDRITEEKFAGIIEGPQVVCHSSLLGLSEEAFLHLEFSPERWLNWCLYF